MEGSPDRGVTRAAVRVPGGETAISPSAARPMGFAANHSTITRVEAKTIGVRHTTRPGRGAARLRPGVSQASGVSPGRGMR